MANPIDTSRWSNPDAYEAYMGRWSRPTARAFLTWLEAPRGAAWVDVGCGTGALAAAIVAMTEPREVIGVDPSAEFIAAAQRQLPDDRARFVVAAAEAIPLASDQADVAVAGLALNLVKDARAGLREMMRVTRSGGLVAAYVWDFAGEMELVRFFWQAAISLDAGAAEFDHANRFPLCQPGPLRALFAEAGLREVEMGDFTVPLPFADFADYWEPHLLPGSSPVQQYLVSLPEERQLVLREQLRATLPVAEDGTVQLRARAWTIRGRQV